MYMVKKSFRSASCFVTLLSFALLTLTVSCAGNTPVGKDNITVSIEPLRYVMESIAGDRYNINVLTPAGASPETYQLTPQQLTQLRESRMYVRMDTLGFESNQLNKITESIPHIFSVKASAGLTPLWKEGYGSESDSINTDPHTWTSPINMKTIAKNICEALCEMDTTNRELFSHNMKHFSEHMDSIDASVRQMLADVPTRSFLVYHPSLGYFARDYGLRQISLEHNGKSPSAERMERLVKQCREDSVRVIFLQKEYSERSVRAIAEELDAKIVVVNPLSYDWNTEILNIAKALSR